MEQTEKQKKTIEILKNNKIDECCEWLLEAHSALSDVSDVESVAQQHKEYCNFSYHGNTYGLFYGNFSISRADHLRGDFGIIINNKIVLCTEVHKRESYIKINLQELKKVMLGDWLEIIPQIATEAKKVEVRQKQQQEEEKRKKREKENEEKSRKLDKNIDLGKYG